MGRKELVLNTEYDDSREEVILDITNLPTLKVEEVKVNSRIISCIRPPMDGVFRGVILDYPIIDVIINDQYVEIRGLIINKLYQNLILNLECISGSKFYKLEDFFVENGDVISGYICRTYKKAFNRDISEEKFNEWYFKLQKDEKHINDFVKSIVYSKEFLESDYDFENFTKILYNLIYGKDMSDDEYKALEEMYKEEIESNSFNNDSKLDIIDEMLHNKQFGHLSTKEKKVDEVNE